MSDEIKELHEKIDKLHAKINWIAHNMSKQYVSTKDIFIRNEDGSLNVEESFIHGAVRPIGASFLGGSPGETEAQQ